MLLRGLFSEHFNSFQHHRYMSGGHGYHQILLILTGNEEELKNLLIASLVDLALEVCEIYNFSLLGSGSTLAFSKFPNRRCYSLLRHVVLEFNIHTIINAELWFVKHQFVREEDLMYALYSMKVVTTSIYTCMYISNSFAFYLKAFRSTHALQRALPS